MSWGKLTSNLKMTACRLENCIFLSPWIGGNRQSNYTPHSLAISAAIAARRGYDCSSAIFVCLVVLWWATLWGRWVWWSCAPLVRNWISSGRPTATKLGSHALDETRVWSTLEETTASCVCGICERALLHHASLADGKSQIYYGSWTRGGGGGGGIQNSHKRG